MDGRPSTVGQAPLPSGTDARGPSCHLYRVPGHHASAGAVLETCMGAPSPPGVFEEGVDCVVSDIPQSSQVSQKNQSGILIRI